MNTNERTAAADNLFDQRWRDHGVILQRERANDLLDAVKLGTPLNVEFLRELAERWERQEDDARELLYRAAWHSVAA